MVIVPDEKIPESCLYCPFTDDYPKKDKAMEIKCYSFAVDGDVSSYQEERHPACPLMTESEARDAKLIK